MLNSASHGCLLATTDYFQTEQSLLRFTSSKNTPSVLVLKGPDAVIA